MLVVVVAVWWRPSWRSLVAVRNRRLADRLVEPRLSVEATSSRALARPSRSRTPTPGCAWRGARRHPPGRAHRRRGTATSCTATRSADGVRRRPATATRWSRRPSTSCVADARRSAQAEPRTIDLFGPPRAHAGDHAPPRFGVEPTGWWRLVVIDDISERRRLEAMRRDFVANISHELKTPVGAIGAAGRDAARRGRPRRHPAPGRAHRRRGVPGRAARSRTCSS